jgi:hypothetical protein
MPGNARFSTIPPIHYSTLLGCFFDGLAYIRAAFQERHRLFRLQVGGSRSGDVVAGAVFINC